MSENIALPAPIVPGVRGESRTRTDILRQQLADDIVSGALEPGTPLDEHAIAQRFGVSRTPVREAIRQLAASGLVVSRAHRGAVVALPTPRELEDMFRAMAELEALCAGLCAVEMSPVDRRRLQELHEEMAGLMRSGDHERYTAANEVFHGLIYKGTGNSYLADLTLQTRLRVSPFRRAQFRAPGRLRASNLEHDAVVRAILRGDRQSASELMRDHIMIVKDAYRALRQ